MKRRASLFVLVTVALLAAACSVPRDDNARVITNSPRNTSVPVTTSNVDAPRVRQVYFPSSDRTRRSDAPSQGSQCRQPRFAASCRTLTSTVRREPLERRSPRQPLPSRHSSQQVIFILFELQVDRPTAIPSSLAFQQMSHVDRLPYSTASILVTTVSIPAVGHGGDKPSVKGPARADYTRTISHTTSRAVDDPPATTRAV